MEISWSQLEALVSVSVKNPSEVKSCSLSLWDFLLFYLISSSQATFPSFSWSQLLCTSRRQDESEETVLPCKALQTIALFSFFARFRRYWASAKSWPAPYLRGKTGIFRIRSLYTTFQGGLTWCSWVQLLWGFWLWFCSRYWLFFWVRRSSDCFWPAHHSCITVDFPLEAHGSRCCWYRCIRFMLKGCFRWRFRSFFLIPLSACPACQVWSRRRQGILLPIL